MKKYLAVMLSLALSTQTYGVVQAAPAAQTEQVNKVLVDQSNPYEMVRQVADLTFKRFANEQVEIRKNPNMLKNIVNEELMPYINYRYAALKVLGRHLQSQKKSDVEAFIPVFRDYLISSYAQVFTLYKEQKIVFDQPSALGSEKIVAVGLTVHDPERPPINIVFQVRRDSKTNEWSAFNLIAEGISLLDSKTAELSSLISQKGLVYVTKLLKEKSESDIVFKDQAES